jgi:hypothetical protein
MTIKTDLELLQAHDAISFEVPPQAYIDSEAQKRNYNLALDAQPQIVTAANAGIPTFLTTFFDPQALRVLQSPNQAAEIFGEEVKGTWIDTTVSFLVVENTGGVSAYDDYSNDGRADINTNFVERQPFMFQTVIGYGDQEVERAGLARLQLVSEKQMAAVKALDKFQNRTYFYGVAGLQNYGLLNDPSLPTPIAPAPKAAGGITWALASANEIAADISTLVTKVIQQANGLLDKKSKFTLSMSPVSDARMAATNQFNVNVMDIVKKNYPNLTVKTAVQYGAISGQNTEGNSAGELVQLIADSVEGQDTGYCATNCKLRTGKIVTELSSFEQKYSQGTMGSVIRIPYGIAEMLGV